MTDSAADPGREHGPGSVFAACPISLREEDVVAVVARLASLGADGAPELRAYLERHPGTSRECAELTAADRRAERDALLESRNAMETVIETAPS